MEEKTFNKMMTFRVTLALLFSAQFPFFASTTEDLTNVWIDSNIALFKLGEEFALHKRTIDTNELLPSVASLNHKRWICNYVV